MHQTRITREMVVRAMLACETTTNILIQRIDPLDNEAVEAWEERVTVATCAQNRALGAILNTLIEEMGLQELIAR